MKNIFFALIAGMLLSCGDTTNGSSKNDDTANVHILDTTKSDSAGMKKDHTENRQNEDSLPPIQH